MMRDYMAEVLISKGLWMIRIARIVTLHLMTTKLMLSAALFAVVCWIGKSIILLMREVETMHDKFLQEIMSDVDLVDKILELLPEDSYNGLTVISTVIDKYSGKIGMSSREVWKMMYTIAMTVHDEMGDY